MESSRVRVRGSQALTGTSNNFPSLVPGSGGTAPDDQGELRASAMHNPGIHSKPSDKV